MQYEAPSKTSARRVLVTGGTGAIGSEIVRVLCAQNSVTANFARDQVRANALQHETACALFQADVGNEKAVAEMFHALAPLDCVVHVAGVVQDALLLRQSVEQWRETLRVNVDGAFLVARAALQSCADGARVVLIASRVGQSGNAGQGAYAASKAAVIALMRCAAREGGERGITFNAVCPGLVLSPLTESLSETRLDELRARSVLNRFGTAGEVASAVQWLLGAEAAGVSGQVVHFDSRF